MALIFIGIPFVVRALQPVEKLDPSYEEAAGALGANRGTIFRKVIFEIIPPALTGFVFGTRKMYRRIRQCNFIAGNKPYETEITPLIIKSELQDFDYSATAL